jgi:hypothetical protein
VSLDSATETEESSKVVCLGRQSHIQKTVRETSLENDKYENTESRELVRFLEFSYIFTVL